MIRSPRARLVSGLAEVARAPVKPFTMLRRSTRPEPRSGSKSRPGSEPRPSSGPPVRPQR
jgi:hypothetical protein